MGQGASTQQDGAQQQEEEDEDHYQVLGIEVTATDDEIKKAFRKQALVWHPDKRPDDVERATARFARIQQAYETLSDAQERAWYDDHRDQILGARSGEDASYFAAMRSGKQQQPQWRRRGQGVTAVQLLKFFNSSAWQGMDDSDEGFYSTFRTLFDLLSRDEQEWDAPTYPAFGCSSTSYVPDVRQFYSAWMGFATEKDFAWADEFRMDDSMDRRMKRLVEKENKRLREQARRDYNDTVRNLASFVRKRDPRYINSKSNPQATRAAEEARIRAELATAAKERAREREAAAAAWRAQAPAWQQQAEPTDSGAGHWDERSDEGDVDQEDEVWCVACERGYRSGGAWDNHERSRKHQRNMARLVKEMQADDERLQADDSDEDADEQAARALADELQELQVTEAASIASTSSSHGGLAREEEPASATSAAPSTKTARRKAPAASDDDEDAFVPGMARKGRRNRARKQRLDELAEPRGEEIDGDLEVDSEPARSRADTPDEQQQPAPAVSKRDRRRAREAAKKADGGGGKADAEKCHVCAQTFSSRTKLFEHIRDSGHAAAATAAGASAGTVEDSAKRKKKHRKR